MTKCPRISFQLDSDGDGKLTFDEFRKMFDKINLKKQPTSSTGKRAEDKRK